MTNNDFPPWLAYGSAVCLLLLIIGLCFAMKRESILGADLPTTVFDASHMQEEPLTRRDVNWSDPNRWKCAICEFNNASKQQTCVLCGTENSTSPNYHKLQALTSRQKCAKQRMEWIRTVGIDNKHYWTRRYENDQETQEDGFVARLSDLRLTFTDCTKTDVSRSMAGYTINSEDLTILQQVAKLPFAEKYAWFIEQTEALTKPWEDGRLRLRIHREHVLVESMEQLLGVQLVHIHMPLRIEFIDESGIDAGGLEREWIALLSEQLFDDKIGLFKQCSNGSYRINPNSQDASVDHLLYFKGVGRLLGRTLLEGQLLQATLCLHLFKHMLGVPLTFSDLEFVDPQIYQSMVWIRDHEGVEELALTFTVVQEDSFEEIELKPNGAQIPVTEENKEEYLFLRLKYIMLGSFSPQLQHLLEGLFQVIPQEIIMVFDYQELELILSGVPEINVYDWRLHTQVSDELVTSPVLEWFWEIVQDMTAEERGRLLQFITGSCRVPVQGFKGLMSYDGRICLFTLKSVPYSNMVYPRAHTCFNRLDLPLYKTKAELEQVLRIVITMEVTGFTDE